MEGSEKQVKNDDGKKDESPIPCKIQEVLQQFQERLSEKDIQITELQKKIETLEVGGGKVTKSLSFRSTTKNQRETPNRPPTGKQAQQTTTNQTPPNGVKTGKHVRSNTNSSTNDKSQTTNATVVSKSVPTSPSKKPTIAPKPTQLRSRQPSNPDPPINGNSKNPRGTISRTASVDRGTKRVLEKIPKRRVNKEMNGTKQNYPRTNFSNGAAGDKILNIKLTCQASKLGRSADSLSTHSADSQASSAADFVSVSSGASPSPTQSVEGNLLGDDLIPYADLALRLKRLTEEHEKLQTEHARLRLQLGSSMDASDGGTLSGESKMFNSSGLWSSRCVSDIESDHSIGGESQGEGAKEFCKEEVLRLRDELLNLQKQNSELNKRLEERFGRIQDLLDERETLNKSLIDKELELLKTSEKMNDLQRENDSKMSKITQLERSFTNVEEERQRFRAQLEINDAKNMELRHQLKETTRSLKDLERESNEMKEFMQAERSTLSEALSDSESQLEKVSSRVAHLQAQLEVKSQSLQAMQTTIEEQKLGIAECQAEMESIKSASRDLLVKQGAELSSSSVAVSQVVQHLESIVLSLTAQVDGHEKTYQCVSSVVLPECDQQVLPCRNNLENLVSSDGISPTEETSTVIDEKRQEVDLAREIGMGMKRDDSAVSINSILSEGGDCPLLGGDISQINTPGKVGCLLDQVKDVEGLLIQLAKLVKISSNNHQIELKKLRDKNIEVTAELERKVSKAEKKAEELANQLFKVELREKQAKSEMQIMQNQLNSTQTALELNQSRYKELSNEYEKNVKDGMEVVDLRQQVATLQHTLKILEAEKKESSEQIVEQMKKLNELTSKNNSVSESSVADLINEKYLFKKEVTKLKIQLNEKDDEINNLRTRFSKHAGILQNNCKYADNEVKQLEEVLDNVVKTLQNIPEVVNSCDSLKMLMLRLTPVSC